jgi:MFS family permease
MSSDTTVQSSAWKPSLLISIVAALVGGAAALAAIHWLYPVFPRAPLGELSLSPTEEDLRIHLQAAIDFRSRNCAVAFGLLGLSLGVAFGLLTTVRRRALSAFSGALAGAAAGAVAGYIAGYFLALALSASANQSLVQSTLFHFSVWAPVLVAAWVAIAAIQAPITHHAITHALTGLLAALVAVTVYGLVGTLLFPTANLLYLVPETLAEQCAWMISCVLVAGVGLHIGLKSNSKVTIPATEQTE